MRRLVVPLAVAVSLVAGCSSDAQPEDELMVSDNPVAATAAVSPAQAGTPAGTVMPVDAVSAMALEPVTRSVVVAVASSLRVFRLDALDQPPLTVALPGSAESLTVADGAVLAAVDKGGVVRVALPAGTTSVVQVPGTSAQAAQYRGETLVAVRDRKEVAVVRDGQVRRSISGGLLSADQVFGTGKGVAVLDRLRNAVFEVDVDKGTIDKGLRAGQGATNGVVDRFDRVLVTDTRGGALLAFSLDPLLLRQRFPVGGSPYGIAYDPRRDLAWVTLTGTNEVVGYDVAGEEPVERHRFATVAQPNAVAVDPASGDVVVASANGGGMQVVRP